MNESLAADSEPVAIPFNGCGRLPSDVSYLSVREDPPAVRPLKLGVRLCQSISHHRLSALNEPGLSVVVSDVIPVHLHPGATGFERPYQPYYYNYSIKKATPMVWDEVDIDPLLPTEKKYSVVKLNTRKPPFEEGAAVKEYEVDDLDEASTPDLMDTVWMAYDSDGNSQVID